MKHRRSTLLVSTAIAALLCAAAVSAQPVSRLKGRVVDEQGAPVEGAEVRAEALFGFAAGDYVGQRTFADRTNAKGEWSVQGLKGGIWIFDAAAPGRLPDAVAVPIHLLIAAGSGASGLMLPWQLVLRVATPPPDDLYKSLVAGADMVRAGDRGAVRLVVSGIPEDADAALVAAGGRVALVARDAPGARGLFVRAVERDPKSFAAALGAASAALMLRDFDAASRGFAAARDRTSNKDEQKYLSAALDELRQVHISNK